MSLSKSETRLCSECNAATPESSLQGLCGRCLLKTGLDDDWTEPNMRIRCPYCHEQVDVACDAPLRDLQCNHCRNRFSLIDPEESLSPTFSRFTLVEVIGSGGFGTVWKAKDRELDRTVAVKIPHKGRLSSIEADQFLREARAAAQLKHPNIVGVHEVGRENGQVYIVSDYVSGLNLAECLDGGGMTHDEAAALVAKAAGAVDHAHQAGVVHRDLKPSNIMIDGAGEPHIMDFGLAKRDVGEINTTYEGRVLGTPAYMAPEQAQGDSHLADPRSDVYALGVILFELLTGEKPFRGDVRTLLQQVIHEDAPSLRKLDPRIPRDLETVCLKCLEKDPQKRYSSAMDLASELRRYANGEPILARPITTIARAWRWCSRNRLVAGLGISVIAMLLVLAIGSPIVAMRQAKLAAEEVAARQRADQEARRLKLVLDKVEEHYRKVFTLLEEVLAEMPESLKHRRQTAAVYNDLAWFLATCPDPELRYPEPAVQLAEMAIARIPDGAEYWETLGVAHYRMGDWEKSIDAFRRAAGLGGNQFGAGGFVLAMACWQSGDPKRARHWYDRSLEWLELQEVVGEEVRASQREATELLGP